jgi:hypothetical protein
MSKSSSCVTLCTIEADRKNSLNVTITKNDFHTHTTSLVPSLAGAGAMLSEIIDYGTELYMIYNQIHYMQF